VSHDEGTVNTENESTYESAKKAYHAIDITGIGCEPRAASRRGATTQYAVMAAAPTIAPTTCAAL